MAQAGSLGHGYTPISEKGYLYASGTLPVLLAAHLDAEYSEPAHNIYRSDGNAILISPQGIGGDDRADAYMALTIWRQACCHVLFCEDEEIGGKQLRAVGFRNEVFPTLGKVADRLCDVICNPSENVVQRPQLDYR